MACNKDHSAILNTLQNLPESQAVIRGRHRCAGCAYDEGYEAGKKHAVQSHEVGELLIELYKALPNYKFSHSGGVMQFDCQKENFKAEFPISVLVEMLRTGQLSRMFLEPAVVPH